MLIHNRLQGTLGKLKQWHNRKLNGMRKRIDELSMELKKIQEDPLGEELFRRRVDVREEMNNLMTKKETFWLQRSRINWMKDGDGNTSYFYPQASNKKRRNKIQGLFDENGVWADDAEDINRIIIEYFKKIFRTQKNYFQIAFCLKLWNHLSQGDDQILMAFLTPDEIYDVVKQYIPQML